MSEGTLSLFWTAHAALLEVQKSFVFLLSPWDVGWFCYSRSSWHPGMMWNLSVLFSAPPSCQKAVKMLMME